MKGVHEKEGHDASECLDCQVLQQDERRQPTSTVTAAQDEAGAEEGTEESGSLSQDLFAVHSHLHLLF